MVSFEAIIWYLVLIDSLLSNVIAWFFGGWYKKEFKKWHKILPLTKAWAGWYLLLVIWIGCALYRLGLLPGFS